jgi:DNA-binding CsgD family transcriptional regulator
MILFTYQFLATFFDLSYDSLSWDVHELIEIMSFVGMILGAVFSGVVLRGTLRRNNKVEEQLGIVSDEFTKILYQKFTEWGLTNTEKEVAILIMKGFSIKEVAELRQKSIGTIKAQNSAIYAKAKVTGRFELMSQFFSEIKIDTVIEADNN